MAEKRTYTDEERADALARYVSDGLAAAAKATGIPSGTIASWATRTDGVRSLAHENKERMRAALEASDLRWQAHKVDLVKQFAGMVEVAIAMAHDSAEDGNVRDMQGALTSAAIATDKAQLLSGGATGRIEHSDADGELAAEVARLVEERRAVAAGAVPMDSRRTA